MLSQIIRIIYISKIILHFLFGMFVWKSNFDERLILVNTTMFQISLRSENCFPKFSRQYIEILYGFMNKVSILKKIYLNFYVLFCYNLTDAHIFLLRVETRESSFNLFEAFYLNAIPRVPSVSKRFITHAFVIRA